MKRILLLISLLFALIIPTEKWGEVNAATQSTEIFFHQDTYSHNTEDNNEGITATLIDSPMAVIMSDSAHPLLAQQRHLSTRSQIRLFSQHLLVRNTLKLLSQHLTTLTQHITRTYTTLKIQSRQYSVDNYIYAYRHIIL